MLTLTLGGLTIELRFAEPVHAGPAIACLRESFGPFVRAPGQNADERVPDEDFVPVLLTVEPDLTLPDVGPVPADGLCYQRTDLRFEMGPARRTARAAVDGSRGALEAVVELTLQGALLRRGGLVVHGMAGVDETGAGWLVPGRSGAGKSTIARAAGFARVLADEAVVLRRVAPGPGGFRVYGTPFWSEGCSLPLDTGDAPLGVLARPIKAPGPGASAERHPVASAAADLLACVMFHDADPQARALVLETACDAAASAECVALRFPKEGPWLSGVVQRRAGWARSSTAR
jgi:hypothetical protein